MSGLQLDIASTRSLEDERFETSRLFGAGSDRVLRDAVSRPAGDAFSAWAPWPPLFSGDGSYVAARPFREWTAGDDPWGAPPPPGADPRRFDVDAIIVEDDARWTPGADGFWRPGPPSSASAPGPARPDGLGTAPLHAYAGGGSSLDAYDAGFGYGYAGSWNSLRAPADDTMMYAHAGHGDLPRPWSAESAADLTLLAPASEWEDGFWGVPRPLGAGLPSSANATARPVGLWTAPLHAYAGGGSSLDTHDDGPVPAPASRTPGIRPLDIGLPLEDDGRLGGTWGPGPSVSPQAPQPPAAPAAFQEGTGAGALAAYPGMGPALNVHDFFRHQRPGPRRAGPHPPSMLSTLGSVTYEGLADLLSSLQPALRLPRAEETSDPVSPALRQQYPIVFPLAFEGRTASRRAHVWRADFPEDYWSHRVEGIGFAFDRRFGPYPSAYFCDPVWLRNHPSVLEPEVAAFIDATVAELATSGRIEDVTALQDQDAEVTRILPLLVADNGSKLRLCWDGRDLNHDVHCPTFQLETVATAARLVRPGDLMFTLDLWNGYHQFALQEDLRRYCCFAWPEGPEQKIWRWRVLPFGLNVAPLSFSKIMRLLLRRWRAQGCRCTNYIDDFLFLADSMEEALRLRHQILADLARYGLVVNASKACLTPSHAVTYLGYVFDTAGPRPALFVPEKKLSKLAEDIRGYVSDLRADPGHRFQGSTIARLCGKLLSMRYALGPVRVATRDLIACLRQLDLRVLMIKGRATAVRDYSGTVVLSAGAQAELRFWHQRLRDWNGLAWHSAAPSVVLYSDGSCFGWGALCRRVINGHDAHVLDWSQERHPDGLSTHSLRTELNALLRALITMESTVRGQTVRHRTDSLGVHYGLRNGGFSGPEMSDLNLLVKRVWLVCLHLDVHLQTEYVGKDVIIHSGADALSRADADDRLQLRARVYRQMLQFFQVQPEWDLFAYPGESQHGLNGPLRYYSRMLETDPRCHGMDALAAPWEGVVYAYPPVYLAQAAVEKALSSRDRAAILLVLPDWPAQPWSALLRPFRSSSLDLGPIAMATRLPPGTTRPIESEPTWSATRLRAWYLPRL